MIYVIHLLACGSAADKEVHSMKFQQVMAFFLTGATALSMSTTALAADAYHGRCAELRTDQGFHHPDRADPHAGQTPSARENGLARRKSHAARR